MALHVMDEANQCLGCKKPRCQQGCPIQTNIPEVIRLLKANKLDEAGRKAGIVRCCQKSKMSAPAQQSLVWAGAFVQSFDNVLSPTCVADQISKNISPPKVPAQPPSCPTP